MIYSREPDVVIPNKLTHELILDRLEEYGDDVAIIDHEKNISLTFKEILDNVKLLATALYRHGLRKGDVVGILSETSCYFGTIVIAIMACGAVPSTCNPVYNEDEIVLQFSSSKPKYMFCEKAALEKLNNAKSKLISIKEIFSVENCKDHTSMRDLTNRGSIGEYPPNVNISPSDVAFLPYSSGTTGFPKGVVLTHYNVVSFITLLTNALRSQRLDSIYIIAPAFHIYGFGMILMSYYAGSKFRFHARFNFNQMLECIQNYKITLLGLVPPVFLLIAKLPEDTKYDLSSVTKILCGAAPLSPGLIPELKKRMKNSNLLQVWGLTEAVPLTISTFFNYPMQSVGMVAPNTVLKIIDTDTGKEVNVGQNGELCAKGPTVFKEYLNNPEMTKRTIDVDGWLHTGDIGHVDRYGYIYIVDRLKELIKYKGFQVAPAELEAILLHHPEISDAAVIGVSDQQAGELPKAFVVRKSLSLTEDDVIRFVAGKVSRFKELKGGVTFVEAIPKSASGKILRRLLRSRLIGGKSKI